MTLYPDIAPNSTQLVGLYQSADVFVLPSLGECFGMATIEAMASGLPVITSDVGGTADIVAPGENGFIVPAGNNRALGEALDSVLADEARRAAMGRRSRELAEARFDAYRNAMRTMDLLKAMIEE